jgi:hypothetical protein
MNRALTPWLALLGACALAGCHSVSSRIEEKAALFGTLSPAVQADLRAGIAKAGDTADMVYIALGRPSAIQDYPSDPTATPPPAAAPDPVTIWYFFTMVSGNPEFDPTPGSAGVPVLDPTPNFQGYQRTAVLVVFRRGIATKVRYFR